MNTPWKKILASKLANGEITQEEYQKEIIAMSQKSLEDSATLVDQLQTVHEDTIINAANMATEIVNNAKSISTLEKTVQITYSIQDQLQKITQSITSLDERMKIIEKTLGIRTTASISTGSSCKQIGRYIIEKTLGEGGFGVVYLATDSENREKVAIKLLKLNELSEKIDRTQLLDEFIREVDVMIKMEHSCVAKVKSAGNYQNSPYVVMEYINGPTVLELIKKKQINTRQCLIIANAIATVLKHGYDQHQLIHRDIKPGNIIFSSSEGTFKLLDFGLAKCLGDVHHQLSMSLTRKGTAFYMSPEQVQNSSKVDFRTDIYALGSTMYFMLTGQPPYANYEPQGYSKLLEAILLNKLTPLKQMNPNIPDFIAKIVEKAMAFHKENRYGSYDEFKMELKQAISLC